MIDIILFHRNLQGKQVTNIVEYNGLKISHLAHPVGLYKSKITFTQASSINPL